MKRTKKATILIAFIISVLLLVSCGNSAIDKACAEKVIGEYQAVEVINEDNYDEYVGGWWHLSILYDDDNDLYLTIYDNEAGNPGIEGKVVSIDTKSISVKYDPDYYDDLPAGKWETEGDYLYVDYEITDEGIILVNNDFPISFNR